MYIEKLIRDCIKVLGLKAPVDIRILSSMPNRYKTAKGLQYSWVDNNQKIKRHVIYISLDTDARSFNTIVVHELIHAWQAEYRGIDSPAHDKSFQNVALTMLGYLVSEGYDIQDTIYDRTVD